MSSPLKDGHAPGLCPQMPGRSMSHEVSANHAGTSSVETTDQAAGIASATHVFAQLIPGIPSIHSTGIGAAGPWLQGLRPGDCVKLQLFVKCPLRPWAPQSRHRRFRSHGVMKNYACRRHVNGHARPTVIQDGRTVSGPEVQKVFASVIRCRRSAGEPSWSDLLNIK